MSATPQQDREAFRAVPRGACAPSRREAAAAAAGGGGGVCKGPLPAGRGAGGGGAGPRGGGGGGGARCEERDRAQQVAGRDGAPRAATPLVRRGVSITGPLRYGRSRLAGGGARCRWAPLSACLSPPPHGTGSRPGVRGGGGELRQQLRHAAGAGTAGLGAPWAGPRPPPRAPRSVTDNQRSPRAARRPRAPETPPTPPHPPQPPLPPSRCPGSQESLTVL